MNDQGIRTPGTVLSAESAIPADLASGLPTEKIPLSPQDRSWLLRQIDRWRELGLMGDTQARSILGLYEERWEAQARTQSTAIFVLMAIAALLVSLAVILVVGFNWEAMPKPMKLATLIGSVAGMHGLGLWLRFGKGWNRSSEIAFFFGCLLYGASIWLIAQIFNLDSHYPDGFWWWAWGILPFALCLDTVLIHVLLVSVLSIWVGTEILDSGLFFLFGRVVAFPPPGAYTLPIFVFLPLLWAYRRNEVAAVWLYLPLVVFWAALLPIAWHFTDQVVFFLGALGSLLLLVAELHPENSRFSIPYRLFGLLMLFGVLTPLSFWEFNQHPFFGDKRDGIAALAPAVVLSFIGLAAVAVAFLRGRQPSSELEVSSSQSTMIRLWLPAGLTLAFAAISYLNLWTEGLGFRIGDHRDSPARFTYALFVTLLANVFFIAAAFWIMWLGLREERGFPFAAGVAAFLFWTVLRYIDLFAEFGGMLGAALMFFLCGAVLFGVAIYWHQRKRSRHEP
ncbi:MAG: DUF2157 domain-containing protein [Gemmataceae bacterium]|nr:DUF2157 domain-containing protein [Gemmataceae bacterium]